MNRKGFLVLAAILASVLAAAPAQAAEESFEQRHALAPGGSVALTNVNGSVLVEGWERDEVEIRARKFTSGEQADLERVEILVTPQPNRIEVHTRYPEDRAVEVVVEYHVRVPFRVRLEAVETVNGNVLVRGVEGRGLLRTVNGSVEVLDAAGEFSARTMNGDVHVELRVLAGDGPLTLETVNGSVVLALPAEAGAELEVRSVNGDFRSEFPVMARTGFAASTFRGTLGSGGPALRLRTVNGGIRVVTARPLV